MPSRRSPRYPAGWSGRGCTERRRDTADRRKGLHREREQELAQAFEPLFRSTRQVLTRYGPAELELPTGFPRHFGEAAEQLIHDMRAGSPQT